MEPRFGGARYSAMTAIGCGLDGIGELEKVELPRAEGETDQAYRERLIVKLDWLCGTTKPIEIADIDEFSKYKLWLENQSPVLIGGLRYLVQQVIYENGRFGAWLMPAVPLQLIDHEWRGPMGTETTTPPDDTKPNHVRDAVRANQ
jgi:hypothetical protein